MMDGHSQLPSPMRLLLINAALGCAAGCLFFAALLATNSFGLLTLIQADAEPLIPALVLLTGCASTFAVSAVATAIAFAK